MCYDTDGLADGMLQWCLGTLCAEPGSAVSLLGATQIMRSLCVYISYLRVVPPRCVFHLDYLSCVVCITVRLITTSPSIYLILNCT